MLARATDLLPGQWAIWFAGVISGEPGPSMAQRDCAVTGELHLAELRRAWQAAVDRHAALRTAIVRVDELPRAVVRDGARAELGFEDLSALAPGDQDRRLRALCDSERRRAIALDAAPLSRLTVVRLGPGSHRLIWTAHPIALDPASSTAVLRELIALHDALVDGRPLPASALRGAADYAAWLGGRDRAAAQAYWSAALDGLETPTLPGIARSPAVPFGPIARPAARERRLPRSLGPALAGLADRLGIALGTLVEGAWAVVLGSYAGSDDVVFGAMSSARALPIPAADAMIGPLDHPVPVRVRVAPGQPLAAWLARLDRQRAAARPHEHWPLFEIKRWTELGPGLPLFETLLVVEPPAAELCGEPAAGLVVRELAASPGSLGAALSIRVATGPVWRCIADHDADRFDPEAVDRMLACLEVVLAAFPACAERSLAEIPLLAAAERATMVTAWNATDCELPGDCVHEQLERQATRSPDAVAVVLGRDAVTYRELDERANQLAHGLAAHGAARGARIGLYLGRTPAMVAAIFAVLKAGAAYVPFDPTLPVEALRARLADAGVSVLITERGRDTGLAAGPPRIYVDDPALADLPRHPPRIAVSPGDLAYLIYTSGSTGRPRGVMVAHGALASFVGHARAEFAITAADRVLQFASISFDTSAEEIYPILVSGGALVLRSDEMLGSVSLFLAACADAGITILDLPTAYWHVLVDGLAGAASGLPPSLRLVIIGGERAKPEQVAAWFRQVGDRVVLSNTYGPTEGTVCATGCALAPGDREVSIGKPIRNVRVFVLDRRGQPVPVGVPGELHLAGSGVAHGYLGLPADTAERFVPDPFAPRPGQRMYRTGDLVKYQPDGSLVFVGRIDTQVKFRGYRIELQEIEAVLARHGGVREAVVMLHDELRDNPRLVAYVTLDALRPPGVAELRGHLRALLPPHMLPSAIVPLPALPLTARGKLDRRALRAPATTAGPGGLDDGAPRTALERRIARLWRDALGVETIRRHDDVFTLGGDSLQLVGIAARLHGELGIRVAIRELVSAPLQQVAALCHERGACHDSDAS